MKIISTPKVPVSVVIPAYNAERFIRQTIESVYAQTFSVDEIIVVDNNCTDQTRKLAENAGAVIVEEKKQYLSAARNKGILACRNEWIALLDADDLWEKNKIEYQWKAVQNCPDAGIITTDFVFLKHASRFEVVIKRKKNKISRIKNKIVVNKHCSRFSKIDAKTLDHYGFLP